ncbi:MAG: DUF58 domain-containing protein [Labilithrix sp.]|nr:DUF58 domain-containing protein [Labilithrix sp.]
MTKRSWPKRAFRIATLVAPTWLAWAVAFSAPPSSGLFHAVTWALAPLWALIALVLVVRAFVLFFAGERDALAQVDVLTGGGSALAWLSSVAIMSAVWLGWPSLAVVGLFGTAIFHVVVLLTFFAARGVDPVNGASITRRFSPEVVTEGDGVIEELRFAGARIPIGFRLFASGRVGPRWATSRHVLEAAESGAEVVVESEIGPAVRGEHEAELVEVWLEDIFGLCRSMRARVAPARMSVLPRGVVAEKTAPLLDRGQGPRAPRAATRLPTEGSFHLREYEPGDDVRRIHWVRSLAAGELVVRLPDEIPPDRPHVRLVLDTYFPEAHAFACETPGEQLDWLVNVWLAVGRSLVESGARVTLVTAIASGANVEPIRRELTRAPTSIDAARRIAAKVTWQGRLLVSQLLTDEATLVVSRAVVATPPENANVRWIVAMPTNTTEQRWTLPSEVRFAFPMGSSENRWSERRREVERIATARRDHTRALVAMRTDIARPPPGSFLATPTAQGTVRLEEIR